MSLLALLILGSQEVPKAEARKVLDGYYRLIHGAKTIKVREGDPDMNGLLVTRWMKKPDLYRDYSAVKGSGSLLETRMYMFGESCYLVNPEEKSYYSFKRTPDMFTAEGFEPFFYDKKLKGKVSRTSFHGREVYEIQVSEKLPGSIVAILVEQGTLVPVAMQTTHAGQRFYPSPLKVEFNVPMDKKDFLWKPPKGYERSIGMRMRKR